MSKRVIQAVPDAIHYTDNNESADYISGWNDCRQAMLAEQPAPAQDRETKEVVINNMGKPFIVRAYVTPQAPVQERPYTYASTQATRCARCGEHKHTPLRIDSMGGYVCLTCIDKQLCTFCGEFGYPEPAPAAPVQEPLMVDIHPPATQRDRWMYEQGRLVERDPRSHAPQAQPAREWVGLTSKEVMDVTRKEGHELLDFIYEYGTGSEGTEERVVAICKAIEAKLKENNA